MNTAFWDFTGGATEDMMLGALIAAGLDEAKWSAAMRRLPFPSWELEVTSGDLTIPTASVHVTADNTLVAIGDLCEWVGVSVVEPARAGILKTMALVNNEATTSLETNSAVATVGVHVASALLEITQHYRTPVWASSTPSPAIIRLFGAETVMVAPERAAVISPMGVALARSLAPRATGPLPLRILAAGRGIRSAISLPGDSGCHDELRLPCVGVVVGQQVPETESQRVYEMLATVDDMDPELLPPLLASIREAGALDAWWSPVVTRNGRPGFTLHVLCVNELLEELSRIVFQHSTTIGVRFHEVQRLVLPRTQRVVHTEIGDVTIKETMVPDGSVRWKAELDDCLRLSRTTGLAVAQVRDLVRQAVEGRSTQ